MHRELHLYIDDSGSRLPDQQAGSGTAWFALGGMLFCEEAEEQIRQTYRSFRSAWTRQVSPDTPLHSYKIRTKKGAFRWLQKDERDGAKFYTSLQEMLLSLPVFCTACVIDRTGYLRRYGHMYERKERWSLCKTAFTILLERTAKFAALQDRVVRVFVEETSRGVDQKIRTYFSELRTIGMPFSPNNMGKYAPLSPGELHHRLYDLKFKGKSSPPMQLADLYLYPLCRARYSNPTYGPHERLVQHGRLIDHAVGPENKATMGVKYSCFDNDTSVRDDAVENHAR